MADHAVCLDTSVLVKLVYAEAGSDAAKKLVRDAIGRESSIVAPAFAWAEVGSVLRKHVRARRLSSAEANGLWTHFLEIPIDFIDGDDLRMRAWRIAVDHDLATVYDAAFVACAELLIDAGVATEFWTADREFIGQLGRRRGAYIHELVIS